MSEPVSLNDGNPPLHVSRVNLKHIESAYRDVSIELYSTEAQHVFKRRFDQMQKNVYHLLRHSISQSPRGFDAEARKKIEVKFENSIKVLGDAAERAERTMLSAGITEIRTSNSEPLVLQVRVFSAYAKRYLEMLGKFDQMMLMLGMMALHKLISEDEMEQQKVPLKKAVHHVADLVRDLSDPRCDKS